jgi:catechol 2,3-dioxygenase-like lactoylglutathione lyase family enzyme
LSLSDARVEPAIPVSDMAKAQEFYENKLGLSGGRQIFDGGMPVSLCALPTEL